MRYMLPEELYQFLKWTGLVFCPAISVLYGVLAPLWNWPHPVETVTTINAIGVFIGTLIGVSQATASPALEGEE